MHCMSVLAVVKTNQFSSLTEFTDNFEEEIKNLKALDLEIALRIAGFAGLPTRDPRGNVLPSLWSKFYDQSTVGLLLERNDVRQLLLKQLDSQIRDRKALIENLETNDVVCNWILNFTKSWEEAYTKQKIAEYDISQMILSAMQETYFLIEPFLSKYPPRKLLSPHEIKKRITDFKEVAENADFANKMTLHSGTDASVRALFRSPLSLDLCRVAGKILKKNEVCNRSGSYSSRIQRNDIQREVEYALDYFCKLILENDSIFKETAEEFEDDIKLLRMTFDHRGQPKQQKPSVPRVFKVPTDRLSQGLRNFLRTHVGGRMFVRRLPMPSFVIPGRHWRWCIFHLGPLFISRPSRT